MPLISLSPRRLLHACWGIIALLVTAHVLAHWWTGFVFPSPPRAVVRLFDLNREANVPTWFSACLLLASAIVCAAIAKTELRYVRHWGALALILCGLSFDEAAAIHESGAIPLRAALHTSGALRHSWVLPASIFVCLVGAAYARFILALPSDIRRLVVGAAAIYVGAAVGGDVFTGYYRASCTDPSFALIFIVELIEETGEMAGMSLFLYAALTHLGSRTPTIRVGIRHP